MSSGRPFVSVKFTPAGRTYSFLLPEFDLDGLGREAAAAELRSDAGSGRFSHVAVDAVLAAAGEPRRTTRDPNPAGLTDREVEVLRLIARGRANKQVAASLGISPKTVGRHVEHIYAKAGVSTRAGATLFAMEHGLLAAVG